MASSRKIPSSVPRYRRAAHKSREIKVIAPRELKKNNNNVHEIGRWKRRENKHTLLLA